MKKLVILAIINFIAIFFTHSLAVANQTTALPWNFDHVVIIVEDLPSAAKDFTQLGFTVIPGRKINNLYQNAFILLSDGTYIALYAPDKPYMLNELKLLKSQKKLNTLTDNLNALEARFVNHMAAGEGLTDFALSNSGSDLNAIIINLDNKGLNMLGPVPMNTGQFNKKNAVWDVAIPEPNGFPLLISDITPKNLRVGKSKLSIQKNGVTSIASITIAVEDIDIAIDDYKDLLGSDPIENHSYKPPANVKIAVYKLGNINIVLAQPLDKTGALYNHINTRGNGLYRIAFYTTTKSLAGKLNPKLTHKTDIKLIYK